MQCKAHAGHVQNPLNDSVEIVYRWEIPDIS